MRKYAGCNLQACCAVVLLAVSTSAFAQGVSERLERAKPIVVAHRGCFEKSPENSLQALRACFPLGIEMAETDVRATKDGVLVLMHDETLDRMTNLSGAVNQRTYAELKHARLRVGAGGVQAALTDEHIPRLAEELAAAKGHIYLLLHVKEPVYDQIFAEVSHAGMVDEVGFLVDALPKDPGLRKAKFLGKSAYFPIVTEHYSERELSKALADYGPLHPAAYLVVFDDDTLRHVDAKLITSADEESVRDPDATWGPLLRPNVSMILTNRASELVAYLKTKK
jgi:glycerophosphoryl diester phosphodiesterase